MSTDDEVRAWFFKRIQDWGLLAALAVALLTIITMLLPIYRKSVKTEDAIEHILAWQSKYTPQIESATTQNAVMNNKIDNLSQQLQGISQRLDSRHSFRYSPKALQRNG
jgi:hypothetical protein